jgi:hypothetical protein
MIHDAKVEVTCDGDKCMESIIVEPPFVYRGYSGDSGYYDCSDDAIEKLVIAGGWTVEDGQHFCESCRETTDDDDDTEAA